jgi:hypothetical protein
MHTGAEAFSRIGTARTNRPTLFPIGSGNFSMGCHHRILERR